MDGAPPEGVPRAWDSFPRTWAKLGSKCYSTRMEELSTYPATLDTKGFR